MNKEECIKKYGEEEYARRLQQNRDWHAQHREEHNVQGRKWQENNPEKVKAHRHEACRKGGKHYEKRIEENRTGLRGERTRVRTKHAGVYRPFKQIIAPGSQLHHEWIPNTSDYRGMALVEKDPHQHGYIDVIQILQGEITLLTEKEVRG